MRPAFKVDVNSHLHWHELGYGDALPLTRMFGTLATSTARRLQQEDERYDRTPAADYVQEAKAVMYGLRGLPFGIHQAIPAAAALAVPNIIRAFQQRAEVTNGLLGKYHFAVLQNNDNLREALALATLERTAEPAQAELSVWLAPTLNRKDAHKATHAFMQWGQQHAGYKHYIAHVVARTGTQRGNLASVMAAHQLGFRITGLRGADAANGNGKATHILRADNWQP